jgi:hypothetical protein
MSTRKVHHAAPHLFVVVKVKQIEAEPDAVSTFFHGETAVKLRASLLSATGNVISTKKSRPLLNFEDEINYVLELPVSIDEYEDLVLQSIILPTESSGKDNVHHANQSVISLELLSIRSTTEGLMNEDTQVVGDAVTIPFMDALNGLLIPATEPERVHEYEIKRSGQSQAIMALKMWAELGTDYLVQDAAITAVNQGISDLPEHSSNMAGHKVVLTVKDNLEAIARSLAIDPVNDADLLWIARELMESPPPPFWVKVNLHDGLAYQNMRTGMTSDTHPALPYFQKLAEKEKQRLRNAYNFREEMHSGGTWIRLGNASERYFYNFQEDHRIEEKSQLPPNSRVTEALPLLVQPHQVNGIGKTGNKAGDPIIRTLTFYTWWKEGTSDGMKRYTTKIQFDLMTQNFIVSFEDSHDAVTLSQVVGRYGPLTQWDLHVTGVINLLGRKTTLKQCDACTLRWLEYRARRLVNLRTAFKDELAKYDKTIKKKEYIFPSFRKDGRTDLAPIIRHIEELYARLSKYRSGLAKKMLNGFEEILSLALLK